MAYEMVRIRNIGDKPFRDGFANASYTILPGKELFVPYDAMALWLGNPTIFDVSARQRGRTTAYQYLRRRYGAFDTTEKVDGVEVVVNSDEMWERNRPRLEVYDLEGNRITTIAEDPEGLGVRPVETSTPEMSGILERLARLETERELLLAAVKSTGTGDGETSGDANSNGSGSDDDGDNDPSPVVAKSAIASGPIVASRPIPTGTQGAVADGPSRPSVRP